MRGSDFLRTSAVTVLIFAHGADAWAVKPSYEPIRVPGEIIGLAPCMHSQLLKTERGAQLALDPIHKTASVFMPYLDANLWEVGFNQEGDTAVLTRKSRSNIWGKRFLPESEFEDALNACQGKPKP